jgi:hypothetical protein
LLTGGIRGVFFLIENGSSRRSLQTVTSITRPRFGERGDFRGFESVPAKIAGNPADDLQKILLWRNKRSSAVRT